ncbi:alkaline phosphatase family protein [Nocardia sp. NPDC058058]|uniref:alkaline phosphatase family protein n=1 Tax=Nocardia sp. NPDC058058 TaxID=3346317 RepID=UPI0036DB9375
MKPQRFARTSLAALAAATAVPLAAGLIDMPAAQADPVVNKVVVLAFDGALYSKIQEAKAANLLGLAAQGVLSQTSIAPHATTSVPIWATGLTGVWDTKHHITGYGGDAFATYPTVFTQLEKAKPQLRTQSIVTWSALADAAASGSPNVDVNTITSGPNAADSGTADLSAAAITNDAPDFLFVDFDTVDSAGHQGSAKPGYLDAINRADAGVGKIVSAVDARAKAHPNEKWNILVTTGNGNRPEGGHGGQSADETANFVIARGPAFAADTTTTTYSIVDITPTVLTLLGVSPSADIDGKSMVAATPGPSTGSFGIPWPGTGSAG